MYSPFQEACNFVRGVILEGGNATTTSRQNNEKNRGFFKEDLDSKSSLSIPDHNNNSNNNNNNNRKITIIHHNKEGHKEGTGISPLDLNSVCDRLVSAALTRGSADNVSVVVVMFGQCSSQI